MERLSKFDWWCVAILLPLWAVCFGLSLHHISEPRGLPSVFVTSPGPNTYPVVTALTPEASTSAIKHGDRLIRVEEADLQGVSRLEYLVRFVEAAGTIPTVRVLYERGGVRYETQLAVDSIAITRALLPASFMFALAAVLLLWRGGPTPQIRAFFLAFMTLATYLSSNFFGTRAETYGALVLHGVLLTVVAPLICRAYLLFPHDERQMSPIWRFGPWALAVLGPLHMSRYGLGLPRDVGVPAVVIGTAVFFSAVLLIMTRNYRRADRIGRRQMRWVIFGSYLAALPVITAGTLAFIDARWMDVYIASFSALGLVPLAILISIVRFNLFDVDRLISVTATYNLLLIGAVALGIIVVPRTAEALSSIVGLDPTTGKWLVAIPLAVLVVIAQPFLRPWIERVFFIERHALDRGFEDLLKTLARCENPSDLTQKLGQGLARLLRPDPCVIYGRDNHTFTPLYAHGQAVPSALPANGPLGNELKRVSTPIALGASARRHAEGPFGDFDRAALQALNAALLAPLNRGDRLFGMLCLGPKRSGDVYTPTDVRLIGAAADRVSAQLDRFDQAEVAVEARAMQDSLRRYVPGAVVDQLARGSDLKSEERETTVLFVDLRGYTAYAEDLRPDEIFSTINEYAGTISGLIRNQGGNVVEFNGDGMMAVFGAPNALEHKEVAAVRSACDIVSAVSELPSRNAANEPLSVGVGIATGNTFVGNIRAADRWIWSAIGNTTNLAARLQSLTRDLDVAIIIDPATREAAGAETNDFKLYPHVSIRGRREVQNVYALPFEDRS